MTVVGTASFIVDSSADQATVAIQDDETAGSDVYATSEQTRIGIATGGLVNTLTSDDAYEELREDANGRLLHEWTFDLAETAEMSLHLEGFTTSTTDVFWVNYSTDGRNYRNLLTIANGTNAIQTRAISVPLTGTGYIKVLDSLRTGDSFSDSVFLDELKLVPTIG